MDKIKFGQMSLVFVGGFPQDATKEASYVRTGFSRLTRNLAKIIQSEQPGIETVRSLPPVLEDDKGTTGFSGTKGVLILEIPHQFRPLRLGLSDRIQEVIQGFCDDLKKQLCLQSLSYRLEDGTNILYHLGLVGADIGSWLEAFVTYTEPNGSYTWMQSTFQIMDISQEGVTVAVDLVTEQKFLPIVFDRLEIALPKHLGGPEERNLWQATHSRQHRKKIHHYFPVSFIRVADRPWWA